MSVLKTRNQNIFWLNVVVLIWGFTAILGALISLDAIPLVWYRMLLAVIVLGVYLKWKGVSFAIQPKTILQLFVAGVIIALHWITFFGAIKVSNVSVALIMMSTGAFFGSLIEPIFFKRRVYKFEVFLGLIVIFALYLIFKDSQDTGAEGQNYILGVIYGLISSFLAALFSVANGVLVKKNLPTVITFYELGFGVLAISIYLMFKGDFNVAFFDIRLSDWVYLFILSSICTAFAFVMSVQIMKVLTPFTVMLTTNLEPVYGIILALIIFGDKEHMSSGFYWGCLVILGVVISNGILKSRMSKKAQK